MLKKKKYALSFQCNAGCFLPLALTMLGHSPNAGYYADAFHYKTCVWRNCERLCYKENNDQIKKNC